MDIVEEILKHNRLALSKGITAVENEYDNAVDIMTKIYTHTGHAYVIGITGPPGAGKSTLLKHVFTDYNRVTFDDKMTRIQAKEEPKLFFLNDLSLREINNIDFNKHFVPTDSYIKERESCLKNYDDIWTIIHKGTYPELYDVDRDWQDFYSSYVNTYLERDVKELSQVGKLDAFYNFLVYMAARTGQELHYDEIARSIGVSAPTAKAWVTILERSGVIYLLRPYASNITKRLVKTPKVYFMDTGLAAYLCRWSSAETLESGAMSGAFFETYVVSELVKNYYNAGRVPDLYYYRDIDKKEIDILIVRDGKAYPIEVKKNKLPDKPDKNFGILGKLGLEVCTGLAICLCNEIMPYSRDCYLVPVTVI